MQNTGKTYDRILKYLKGLLSGRERHDFERNMDTFDEEALEGLSQLTSEEADSDIISLLNRLDNRIKKERAPRISGFWRIAASVLFLTGVGALLYILLKSPEQDMLTQEVSTQHAPQETAVPSVPETAQDEPERLKSEQLTEPADSEMKTEKSKSDVNQVDEIISNQTINEEADVSMAIEATGATGTAYRSESYVNDSMADEPGYITGRVLGVNRKALSGVSVSEEGSNQVATTDMNGNFRIKVSSPASKIELSYDGYKDMEVASKEVAGKEISLDEELIASNDIVVLNYNNVKISEQSSRSAEKAKAAQSTADTYKRPLPPGGSMKNFESWVESRIDTMRLKDMLPGNYKIRLKLTVYKDGTIGNISVTDEVPDIAVEEYSRAVSLSERWQPAMTGNLPVDSDIMIEFLLIMK